MLGFLNRVRELVDPLSGAKPLAEIGKRCFQASDLVFDPMRSRPHRGDLLTLVVKSKVPLGTLLEFGMGLIYVLGGDPLGLTAAVISPS